MALALKPTASLDALAERELFERLVGAARESAREYGSILVLTSHRFSTVASSDIIIVMENGQMVEYGTHETLLHSGGVYSEMYTLQARAYQASWPTHPGEFVSWNGTLANV